MATLCRCLLSSRIAVQQPCFSSHTKKRPPLGPKGDVAGVVHDRTPGSKNHVERAGALDHGKNPARLVTVGAVGRVLVLVLALVPVLWTRGIEIGLLDRRPQPDPVPEVADLDVPGGSQRQQVYRDTVPTDLVPEFDWFPGMEFEAGQPAPTQRHDEDAPQDLKEGDVCGGAQVVGNDPDRCPSKDHGAEFPAPVDGKP
ncbi:unnamed protein product [Pseudo-nitzschia multistriata]|uniref:Uncharacterized protein n=1 Tax=Pseudo-nitzschia multistriata TaxID=183589 RepID=A0A448Z4G9_9STRA|nr:unnamed protein product [Pseudo-nitzschia multistriata]